MPKIHLTIYRCYLTAAIALNLYSGTYLLMVVLRPSQDKSVKKMLVMP